jgi:hypothetical protein
LPSGPSSSFCCATTIGAVCACDGRLASCMAVKAVVASSASRRFVMYFGSQEGFEGGAWRREDLGGELNRQTPAINEQALGWIVAGFTRGRGFICGIAPPRRVFVHYAFTGRFHQKTPDQLFLGFHRTRRAASGADRRWRSRWLRRAGYRQFVRHVARKFVRVRWFTRVVHGWRNFGLRIPGGIFPRWLGGLARGDRRIFGWIDRHRVVTQSHHN